MNLEPAAAGRNVPPDWLYALAANLKLTFSHVSFVVLTMYNDEVVFNIMQSVL